MSEQEEPIQLNANELLAMVEQIDARVFELAVERVRNIKLQEMVAELKKSSD